MFTQRTMDEAKVPLILSLAISWMNIGVRMKIPPDPIPQMNLDMHSVITSCAITISTQLMINGKDISSRHAFLPILSTSEPKSKVPTIPPKLTLEPIQDASEEEIGPVGNKGSLSDINSRKAGEVHPQPAPKDIGRRLTVVRSG